MDQVTFSFWTVLLVVFSCSLAYGSWNSCYHGDEDCPACPNQSASLNFTSLLLLGANPALVTSALAAENVIKQYPGVISLNPLPELHTSLNYFCCYSLDQLAIIQSVLRNFSWIAMNLTYDQFGCNLDHDNYTIYLHAKPDEAGQTALFNMIRGIEAAIVQAGVPVRPRQQSFHMTLARVTHEYPVDEVVQKFAGVNFGTVHFSWFEMLGIIYHASSTSAPAAA